MDFNVLNERLAGGRWSLTEKADLELAAILAKITKIKDLMEQIEKGATMLRGSNVEDYEKYAPALSRSADRMENIVITLRDVRDDVVPIARSL